MGIFKKRNSLEKMKKKISILDRHPYLTGKIGILKDFNYGGFYVKVLSDNPNLFFHVSKKGVVKPVNSDQNLLVKNNAAALLLSAAVLLEVK